MKVVLFVLLFALTVRADSSIVINGREFKTWDDLMTAVLSKELIFTNAPITNMINLGKLTNSQPPLAPYRLELSSSHDGLVLNWLWDGPELQQFRVRIVCKDKAKESEQPKGSFAHLGFINAWQADAYRFTLPWTNLFIGDNLISIRGESGKWSADAPFLFSGVPPVSMVNPKYSSARWVTNWTETGKAQ